MMDQPWVTFNNNIINPIPSEFQCPSSCNCLYFHCIVSLRDMLRKSCNRLTWWVSNNHVNPRFLVMFKSGIVVIDFEQINGRGLPGYTSFLLGRACIRLGFSELIKTILCWGFDQVESTVRFVELFLISPSLDWRHHYWKQHWVLVLLNHPRE